MLTNPDSIVEWWTSLDPWRFLFVMSLLALAGFGVIRLRERFLKWIDDAVRKSGQERAMYVAEVRSGELADILKRLKALEDKNITSHCSGPSSEPAHSQCGS